MTMTGEVGDLSQANNALASHQASGGSNRLAFAEKQEKQSRSSPSKRSKAEAAQASGGSNRLAFAEKQEKQSRSSPSQSQSSRAKAAQPKPEQKQQQPAAAAKPASNQTRLPSPPVLTFVLPGFYPFLPSTLPPPFDFHESITRNSSFLKQQISYFSLSLSPTTCPKTTL
jgi:DNA mismatch repair ATPase MutL